MGQRVPMAEAKTSRQRNVEEMDFDKTYNWVEDLRKPDRFIKHVSAAKLGAQLRAPASLDDSSSTTSSDVSEVRAVSCARGVGLTDVTECLSSRPEPICVPHPC